MSSDEYYLKKLHAFSDIDQRIFDRGTLDVAHVSKVHIVGVCGTAMGSLAGLFVQAGYTVSGSDTGCYPPMSDLIAQLGIDFREGYEASHVDDADVVVIGNIIRPDNPEALRAREKRIPMISLPEALQMFFMHGRRSLVVAGTHGKTTTTGLLIHVLKTAGYKPGYMVGGVMVGDEESFSIGATNMSSYSQNSHEVLTDQYFVLEGDEYDTAYFDKRPKFLNYTPTSAIVASVEFDHADIYTDMDDYRKAFEFFVHDVTDTLVLYGDNDTVRALMKHTSVPTITYGFSDDVQVTATGIKVNEEGQTFRLLYDAKDYGELFVPLCGKHNLLNTLAVCALCIAEGVPLEAIKNGLASFKGMKRRQEIRGIVNDTIVIDDFAHHPTAVRETIRGVKEHYPTRRLIAIFEPRSNTSRRKLFEAEYAKSFDEADSVYLSVPPFLAHRDSRDDMMDVSELAEQISERGVEAHALSGADAIIDELITHVLPGDVLLVMSNGGFDGIHEKLLGRLKTKE